MTKKKRQTRRAFGSIRKLPSGKYQASYTGPDGARHNGPHTFATKGDAEGWLNTEERQISLDVWQPPAERSKAQQQDQARRALTVGAWLDQFHDSLEVGAGALRGTTMANYRKVVRNRITSPAGEGASNDEITRLASISLIDLTKQDVYRWWDGIKASYGEAGHTVSRQAYGRLRAACAEAVRREMITTNPVDVPKATRKPRKRDKYVPDDWEMTALIDAVPEHYKAAACLIFHHGLRIGEALAVELDHVKVGTDHSTGQQHMTVDVRQNAQAAGANKDGTGKTRMVVQPPKTNAGFRTVPIMAVDVPLMMKHLAIVEARQVVTEITEVKPGSTVETTRPARLLTVTTTGHMVTPTSARGVFKRAGERAGVSDRIHPHCGRYWLVTRLAEKGAHLKEIGALLGQDDMNTIMDVYMQVRAERTTTLMGIVNDSLEG